MARNTPCEKPSRELRIAWEEVIESAHQKARDTLAEDLLDAVVACTPQFFERMVVDLLVRMGYGGTRQDAGQAIGQAGDGGIDGIIKEDRLWTSCTSRPNAGTGTVLLAALRSRSLPVRFRVTEPGRECS